VAGIVGALFLSEAPMYSIGKNKYWSSAEVATHLGISKASVLRFSNERTLPYITHPINGKYRLFREQDVVNLLNQYKKVEQKTFMQKKGVSHEN
jgi:hypothetical protein